MAEYGNYLETNDENQSRARNRFLLENSPYYHHHVSPAFIEKLLKRNGDFLLYDDWSKVYVCTIAVRWSSKLVMIPVIDVPGGEVTITGDLLSADIGEMISHYAKTGEYVSSPDPKDKVKVKLIEAIPRQSWELIGYKMDSPGSQVLGSGNFSLVRQFSCKNPVTENVESIAIKFPKRWYDNLAEEHKSHLRNILFDEAKTVFDLKGHPNIVSFRGIFLDIDFPAFIMDIVQEEGMTLRGELRKKTSPWLQKPIELAIDAASAVAFLHEKGYLHRCICTEKFMVKPPQTINDRSRLVLVGFRSARFVGEEEIYSARKTSPLPLPACHSAPESLSQAIWMRGSDIWSLALVIRELLGGKSELKRQAGVCPKDFFAALVSGYRAHLDDAWGPEINNLLQLCWSLDVSQRPSADSIVSKLKQSPGLVFADI